MNKVAAVSIGLGVIAAAFAIMHAQHVNVPALESLLPTGSGEWQVEQKPDPLDHSKSTLQAIMTSSAESDGRSGRFEVTATCVEAGLELAITYLSASNDKAAYKITGRNEVDFRIALDDKVFPAFSYPDFTNQVKLEFNDGLAKMLGFLRPADIYRAKVLKMELPLDNGDLPILVIRPQDPTFQRFVSRCKARYSTEPTEDVDRDDATTASGPDAETESLMATARVLEEKCRNGNGDATDVTSACDARDTTLRKLKERGWCPGQQGDSQWHKCGLTP